MFGLIKFLLSLIGFLVVVLVVGFLMRAQIATEIVKYMVKHNTGYELLADTATMEGDWWPPSFSMGPCVLLNRIVADKPVFIAINAVQMNVKRNSENNIWHIESMLIDIDQVVVVRTPAGELNFEMPNKRGDFVSTMLVENLTVNIRSALYYDYMTSDNPVPVFYEMNYTESYESLTTPRQIGFAVLDPVNQLLPQSL